MFDLKFTMIKNNRVLSGRYRVLYDPINLIRPYLGFAYSAFASAASSASTTGASAFASSATTASSLRARRA